MGPPPGPVTVVLSSLISEGMPAANCLSLKARSRARTRAPKSGRRSESRQRVLKSWARSDEVFGLGPGLLANGFVHGGPVVGFLADEGFGGFAFDTGEVFLVGESTVAPAPAGGPVGELVPGAVGGLGGFGEGALGTNGEVGGECGEGFVAFAGLLFEGVHGTVVSNR